MKWQLRILRPFCRDAYLEEIEGDLIERFEKSPSQWLLILMLSKDYSRLILIAIALSIPLVWIGGSSWLDRFATRINIGLDLFLVPALILILVAILTVSQRTLKSAYANPVESLKDE